MTDTLNISAISIKFADNVSAISIKFADPPILAYLRLTTLYIYNIKFLQDLYPQVILIYYTYI